MKKLRILFPIIYVLFFLSACQNSDDILLSPDKASTPLKLKLAPSYLLTNWMGSINDSKTLSEISIPGTHESCARVEPWPNTAICQSLSLNDQLNAGIRFVDIRCRHFNDAFVIHHGSVYQNMNFSDVLSTCINFLTTNPTECIVMSVNEEYDAANNTSTFEQRFDNYVTQNPTKWYLGAATPTLGSVRGKIVLFRRFNAIVTPKGLDASNWSDNKTSFTINNGYQTMRIQDNYVVPTNSVKWTNISNLLNEAKTATASTLFVNFSSGYKSGVFSIPNISTVSNYMNPKIDTYFTTNTSGRFGIVPMDFANATISKKILSTNF
jgi:1-phosphatidylinositol phosphodiesterase